MPALRSSVYSNADDLVAYLRAARLGELVNDDGSKTITGADSQNALNEQLWRTERIVHGYIGASYATPQTEARSPVTFGALAEMINAITAHRLFARGLIVGGAVSELKAASDAAYAQLARIQKGDAALPSDALQGSTSSGQPASSFMGGGQAPIFGDPDLE